MNELLVLCDKSNTASTTMLVATSQERKQEPPMSVKAAT